MITTKFTDRSKRTLSLLLTSVMLSASVSSGFGVQVSATSEYQHDEQEYQEYEQGYQNEPDSDPEYQTDVIIESEDEDTETQNISVEVMHEFSSRTNATRGRNYRSLNLTPGANVTEMRFTWHSGSGTGAIRINPQNDPATYQIIPSNTTPLTTRQASAWFDNDYIYFVHQLAVDFLQEDTVYEYVVMWEGGESEVKTFRTGGADHFQFLVAGDVQIGIGAGGQTAFLDGQGWENTLDVASQAFPNLDFILSLGDQVHTRNDSQIRAQYMHDYMFAPTQLHSMPLVPVVGNHDGGGANNANHHLWHHHYNTPAPTLVNATEGNAFRFANTFATQFDYWYRWGNVFFIVLDSNTQTMSPARLAFIEDAIAQNEDAQWRIATFHHSPYSVWRPTNQVFKVNIINNWIPHLEDLQFDAVFSGHCHVYSRTTQMLRNQPQRNQQWLDGNGNIRTDATGVAYNAVLDPTGIVYIALNTSSGSGYYNVRDMPRSYIANYNQNFRRNFTVVNVTPHTFSIATYQVINDNSHTLVDVYTLVSSDENQGVPSEVTSLRQAGDEEFIRVTPLTPIINLNGLDLPARVPIETSLRNNIGGNTNTLRSSLGDLGSMVSPLWADVTWEQFDVNDPSQQHSSVSGIITLPHGVSNPYDLPLTVTIDVIPATTRSGITTSSNTTLRTGPGSNYETIQSLPRGTAVIILNQEIDDWWLIQVGEYAGWVRATSTAEIHSFGVTIEPTNLRREPDSNSESLQSLSRNTDITILGSSGDWVLVQAENRIGWISARDTQQTQVLGVTTATTTLRSNPNSNSEGLQSLSRNTNVVILKTSESWVQVQVGSHIGWVREINIREVQRPAVITASSATLRVGPNSNFDASRTLNRNTDVTVLKRSASWSQVQAGSRIGWVRTSEIREITTHGTTTSSTTLRREPNSASSSVRSLSRNARIHIIANHGNWSQVRTGNHTGWVRTTNIAEVQRPAVVTASSTTLRLGPSSSFDASRTLNRNTDVTILKRSGNWSQVQAGSRIGWVRTSAIREITMHGTTTRSTTLRREPNSASSSVRSLSRNARIHIIANHGNWTQIRAGNHTGWVRTNAIQTAHISARARRQTAFRTRPSSGASRIRTVNQNAQITVLGRHGNWSRVRIGNQFGWIRTSDIR